MNNFCMLGKFTEFTRNTIIKTSTQRNDQVRFTHCHIGSVTSMHTKHRNKQLVIVAKCSSCHKCLNSRNTRFMHKVSYIICGICIDDTTTKIKKRSLGFGNGKHRFFDLSRISFGYRLVCFKVNIEIIIKLGYLCCYILWNIYMYRTWTPTSGNVECLFENTRQIFRTCYKIIVLCTASANPYRIDFLKCIGTDKTHRYLTGNNDKRNGIHIGICKACYGIGKTGTRCNHSDTDSPTCFGIPFCRMNSCLLMACEDVLKLILLVYFVIDVHNSPTGVAENCVDPFTNEGFYNHLCTAYLHHKTPKCSKIRRLY